MPVRTVPIERRFWRFVRMQQECWPWLGATIKGYGKLWDNERGISVSAHVVSYQIHYGPVPEGLEPDHLCNNPICVRPHHLEAVTRSENVRRGWERGRKLVGAAAMNRAKSHCPRSHELTPENTIVDNGRRRCRTCRRAAMIEYKRTYREKRACL